MSDPTINRIEKAIKGLTAQYDKLNRTVTELVSNEDHRTEAIAKLLKENNDRIDKMFEDVRKDIHDSVLFVHYRMKEFDDSTKRELRDIDSRRDSGQKEAWLFRRLTIGGIALLVVLMLVFGLFVLDKVYNGR